MLGLSPRAEAGQDTAAVPKGQPGDKEPPSEPQGEREAGKEQEPHRSTLSLQRAAQSSLVALLPPTLL